MYRLKYKKDELYIVELLWAENIDFGSQEQQFFNPTQLHLYSVYQIS